MVDGNHGGICSILHSEIGQIPSHIMAEAHIILDEAHLVLREPSERKKLLEADKVVALSATFGSNQGLRDLTDALRIKGATVESMNPSTKARTNFNTTLKSIPYKFDAARWKGGWGQTLLEHAADAWTEKQLPTLIVTKTVHQSLKVHQELKACLCTSTKNR